MELESSDETLLKPMAFDLQRILVPVDFSDMSKKALHYALLFATTFDAELILVHVLQPYNVAPEIGYLPPELAASGQELVASAREQLKKLVADEIGTRARSQVRVCEEVPWHEIVSAANDTGADLVILSTHGRTGLSHALMGSVAERVVRHAACPVLVVRDRERDFIPLSTRI